MKSLSPWKILHLDLSQPIPALPQNSQYQGVYLVAWWHSIPLGRLEIPADRLPMPASQLLNLVLQTVAPTVAAQRGFYRSQQGLEPQAELSATGILNGAEIGPLQGLAADWSPSQPTHPTVSVVICTRDRPEQLAKTLRSLLQLHHTPDEILVVDNAPTSEATQQLVTQFPQVRYILEPQPGLSLARNTGMRHSCGDVIAFTDDDVTAHPDWLTRLCSSFSNPDVMAVTGLVLPEELATESQVIFELGHGCLRGDFCSRMFDQTFFAQTRAIGVPVWQIGAGANMALRRSIVQQVGGFDPRLGAGAAGCSEDSEYWYRILAAGGLCLYEPSAVVYHTHRHELSCLQSQLYQYMRGHVAALLIQFARYRHWGNLYRVLIDLPRYCLGCLGLGLITGFRGKYRTAIAETLGCLAGVLFYLRHPAIAPPGIASTDADGTEPTTASPTREIAMTGQNR